MQPPPEIKSHLEQKLFWAVTRQQFKTECGGQHMGQKPKWMKEENRTGS